MELSDPRTQVHNETIGPDRARLAAGSAPPARRSLLHPPAPPRQHAHLERPLPPLVGRPSHRRRRGRCALGCHPAFGLDGELRPSSSEGSAAAPAESGSTGTAAARSSRQASPSIHPRPSRVERRREPRLERVLDAAQDGEPPPGTRQIRSGGEAVPKNAAALLHRGVSFGKRARLRTRNAAVQGFGRRTSLDIRNPRPKARISQGACRPRSTRSAGGSCVVAHGRYGRSGGRVHLYQDRRQRPRQFQSEQLHVLVDQQPWRRRVQGGTHLRRRP